MKLTLTALLFAAALFVLPTTPAQAKTNWDSAGSKAGQIARDSVERIRESADRARDYVIDHKGQWRNTAESTARKVGNAVDSFATGFKRGFSR